MKKRDLKVYAKKLEGQLTRLEDTVKFLAEHSANHLDFVYKKTGEASSQCYARYIYDGLVECVSIETYPTLCTVSHHCIENNRDYAVIESSFGKYKIDKKTKKCKFIKEND